MTQISRAKNVKIVSNIEPKSWLQFSGPRSGFLVLDLKP